MAENIQIFNPHTEPLVFIEILDNNDDERNYIEYYFYLGHNYERHCQFTQYISWISMSVHTLK